MSAFDRLESQLLERVAERGERVAPASGAPRAPRPQRSRRSHWVLGGATVALATAAVLVTGVLPVDDTSPTGLLTPEQAVAAASRDLESDGILEWVDFQGASGDRPGGATTGTRIARWIDLETGDRSEFHTMTYSGRSGRPTVSAASLWHLGRTSWLDEGPGRTKGKQVIEKTVVDRPPVDPEDISTPVTEVREDLRRAAAGKSDVADAGVIDGVPAVRIVDVRRTYTKRVWISRERSPRVLRSSFTSDCMEKLDGRCRPDMPKTVYAPMTTESRTLTWRIHPRTEATLAKVHPPAFDPAKYRVVTTHRD